jgi:hypothetical protein
MTYIINQSAIILFINNGSVRVEKTDRKYPKIIKSFTLPSDEQEDAINEILYPIDFTLESIDKVEGFEIIEDQVYYNGEALPPALSQKVESIVRDDLPLEHFTKFWNNLEDNPASSSVDELMEFLEYKELPITDDGCFLAYKGVSEHYYSIHGNPKTVVVQGITTTDGKIFNGVGSKIEVKRRNVDDNRNNHCSFGLHVGSLDYARSFGQRVVVVKVNPKDVVSVPTDYNCQKCRVSAYEVVSDYEYEIESSVTDGEGNDSLVPNFAKERTAFVERVEKYLNNKRDEGYDDVSVRQIQNSFSPEYPSKQEVLDALQELNEYWDEIDGVTLVIL